MYYNLTYNEQGLIEPLMYSQMSVNILNQFVNGCGTEGMGKLVSNKVAGIDIIEACKRHDLMYFLGQNIKDKKISDMVFKYNMYKLIKLADKNWFVEKVAYGKAYIYYQAVNWKGSPAFCAKDIKYIPTAYPYFIKYHSEYIENTIKNIYRICE